jgi:hypothetical protein
VLRPIDERIEGDLLRRASLRLESDLPRAGDLNLQRKILRRFASGDSPAEGLPVEHHED